MQCCYIYAHNLVLAGIRELTAGVNTDSGNSMACGPFGTKTLPK